MGKVSMPHTERTAGEPRNDGLHEVTIDKIDQVNDDIRLFRLVPKDNNEVLKFLPGQWLDVYTPTSPKAGGFTITSPPSLLTNLTSPATKPYLELAIQKSPQNPPAAYLWQPHASILNTPLNIRVGGSFIFPPKPERKFKRVVFVAGGVGVNPLMSMLSHIADMEQVEEKGFDVKFLYTTRTPTSLSKILFHPRILDTIASLGSRASYQLFLTPANTPTSSDSNITSRRITTQDLTDALGLVESRGDVLCYICGPPGMTDEFVEILKNAEGVREENVLFEKWW